MFFSPIVEFFRKSRLPTRGNEVSSIEHAHIAKYIKCQSKQITFSQTREITTQKSSPREIRDSVGPANHMQGPNKQPRRECACKSISHDLLFWK
jgi:hypothetical protein